jgi:hypothetical protein
MVARGGIEPPTRGFSAPSNALIRRVFRTKSHSIQALSGNQGKLAEAYGNPKPRLLDQDWSEFVQSTPVRPRESIIEMVHVLMRSSASTEMNPTRGD